MNTASLFSVLFRTLVMIKFVPDGRFQPDWGGIPMEDRPFQLPFFERVIHLVLVFVGIDFPLLYFTDFLWTWTIGGRTQPTNKLLSTPCGERQFFCLDS